MSDQADSDSSILAFRIAIATLNEQRQAIDNQIAQFTQDMEKRLRDLRKGSQSSIGKPNRVKRGGGPLAIIQCLQGHPGQTIKQISVATGLSISHVGRILGKNSHAFTEVIPGEWAMVQEVPVNN